MASIRKFLSGLKKLCVCCFKDPEKDKEQPRSLPEKVSDFQPCTKENKDESSRPEVIVPSSNAGYVSTPTENLSPPVVKSDSQKNSLEIESEQTHSPENLTNSHENKVDSGESQKFAGDESVQMGEANNQSTLIPDTNYVPSPSANLTVIEEKPVEEAEAANAWIFDISSNLTEVVPSVATESPKVFFGTVKHGTNELEKITKLKRHDLSPEDRFSSTVVSMNQRGFEVAIYQIEKSECLAVVFNLNSAYHLLERYRFELKRDEGIEIPEEDNAANDAIVFGYLFAEFVAHFDYATKDDPERKNIRLVFHDWSEAIGLIFLNLWKVPTENIYKPITGRPEHDFSLNIDHRVQIEQMAVEMATSSSV